jgi:hypothetical protein
LSALGVVPGDGTEVRGGVYMTKGRVGEERGGKEMDGCPLTVRGTPLISYSLFLFIILCSPLLHTYW